MSSQRESVTVLEECIDLQQRKSRDYQNPNSNIVQAMHYRRGVSTIHDMVHQKLLRAQSLLEPLESGDGSEPNFESLEDTYKDAINYLSFAVSYIRGKMEGQDPGRDMLNRAKPINSLAESVVFTNPAPHSEMQVITRKPEPLPIEEKIKRAYSEEVKPKGMITVPVDEPRGDSIMSVYVKDVKDIGDRLDDTFDNLAKPVSEK